MKRFSTSLLLLFFFILKADHAFAQVRSNDDPDLPSFASGVDKEKYLKAREDNINMIRGLPWKLPYNPRVKAIEVMKQQEFQNSINTNNLTQAPNWQELGPSPIPNGQTTTFSVPVSGRTTAIAVHPTNPNLVYVGTANGGIYRTTNGGTSWTQIFDGSQSLAIGALALAPSDPTILYVGTGEGNLSADSYAGVGLYRINSADVSPVLNGPINPAVTTGVAGTTAFTGRTITKILVDPTNAANVFVSTASGVVGNPGGSAGGGTIPPLALRGLYRSTNATAATGSVAFTKLKVTSAAVANFGADVTGNRNVMDMVMQPGNPDTIVCYVYGTAVAGDGGIYRTTNALAATPTFTQTYVNTSSNVRGELAINKTGAVVTVYCGNGENTNGRILKSIDGGITWAIAGGTYTFCSGQCFYDIAIEVDPTNANNVYVGGSSGANIFKRSIDGAATAFVSSTTNLHSDCQTVVCAPSLPTTLYLGCDGGIFKSTDAGVTWTSINTAGFKATQFQSIAVHPTNTIFTIGGTQDNGTSMLKTDGTFNRIDFGDGGYAAIDQNAADVTNVTMYHTYFNQTNNLIGFARVTTVAAATDGNWDFLGCNGNVPGNGVTCTDNTLFYAPIVLGPGNPNTVYFGSDRLYRSVDKGTTMVLASQAPVVAGASITTIAVSKLDDNVRILAVNNGTVWATTTGSATLVNVTPPGGPAAVIGRVALDPNNINTAYVCYLGFGVPANNHIWKTTNLNAATPTWAASGAGIPDVPVNSFAIDPGNSNIVYAGTDIGVYMSSDAGVTWTSYNGGLPVVPIFDMVVHPVSHLLKIATHGRGFWTTTASVLPVTFTTFTATPRKNAKVYLEWFTSSEFNNKGFELQVALKSNSNPVWKKVTFVNGSGTSSSPHRYSYEDQPTGGKKYLYRIKQIDIDNHFTYSDIREIDLKDFDYGIQAYPNPAQTTTVIKYQLTENGNVSLTLFNTAGEQVKVLINERKDAGIYELNLNTSDLPAGNYYYTYKINDFFMTKKLVIVK